MEIRISKSNNNNPLPYFIIIGRKEEQQKAAKKNNPKKNVKKQNLFILKQNIYIIVCMYVFMSIYTVQINLSCVCIVNNNKYNPTIIYALTAVNNF